MVCGNAENVERLPLPPTPARPRGPSCSSTDHALAQSNQPVSLGRHATPEELAGLFAYLASDEAAYFTGSVILMDGGETTGSLASGPGGPGA